MIFGYVKAACGVTDTLVADVSHNKNDIIGKIKDFAANGVKVALFPELALTGYTCGDLFLQDRLLDASENALFDIAKETENMDVISIVGSPLRRAGKLYNCGVAIYHGDILAVVPKQNMPNYSEFYELRHFAVPTDDMKDITLNGKQYPFGRNIILINDDMPEMSIGIEICEDLWTNCPPSTELTMSGANIICNLSAGDEIAGKADYRRGLVSNQSARLVCGYVYSNAGTGESTTDMVFSGHSMIYEDGKCLSENLPFEKCDCITEIDVSRLAHERQRLTSYKTSDSGRFVHFSMKKEKTSLSRVYDRLPFVPDKIDDRAKSILDMQVYGLKKRIEHTHSKSVVLGISGGLDSTLALIVCAATCDCLGIDRKFIHAITMPCFGTTQRTKSNAEKLCNAFGVSFEEIDIANSVKVHLDDLKHDINDHNVVYENAQARTRTLILMNKSNQLGGFVVGTGDLSELALGWATYNGDHMSMYGVNASIPKTLIKYIVRYYADSCGDDVLKNTLIDVLDTPISPELLPADDKGNIAQKTEDLVGPYELHDFFIYYTLRYGFSPKKLFEVAKYAFCGEYDDATIYKWLLTFYRRFFAQQFKRSCLPDGVKVGSVSLSPRGDFRMPSDAVVSAWIEELHEINI